MFDLYLQHIVTVLALLEIVYCFLEELELKKEAAPHET